MNIRITYGGKDIVIPIEELDVTEEEWDSLEWEDQNDTVCGYLRENGFIRFKWDDYKVEK